MPELDTWLQQEAPEVCVTQLWKASGYLSPVAEAMHGLLVIQAFRPDRIVPAAKRLVETIFNKKFMFTTTLDLERLIDDEQSSVILICSITEFDVSSQVEELAAKLEKPCACIAIGPAEGFLEAEQAINMAVTNGCWVLLKNVHLALQWLKKLETMLHPLEMHPNFRHFLTTEANPKLPVTLLRAGRILICEQPPGVCANLLRTFTTVPLPLFMKAPGAAEVKLYFLICWFHAIVQIPWSQIQTIIHNSIYGGYISTSADDIILSNIVKTVLSPDGFNAIHKTIVSTNLLYNLSTLKVHDIFEMKDPLKEFHREVMDWLKQLPSDVANFSTRYEKDPLFHFFEEEISVLKSLLPLVRKNLEEIGDYCQHLPVWLGGLVNPTKFLETTKLMAAKETKIAFEDLVPRLSVSHRGSSESTSNSFTLVGLALHGATFSGEKVKTSTTQILIECSSLTWERYTFQDVGTVCKIPVYMYSNRKHLLCMTSLHVEAEEKKNLIMQGVAFVTSHSFN
ncbi:hypothetical protein B566_EDAN015005 [Ephemera danica]|nr:hypothetical protein B566_EDAN015005 [Ephemera danica]